MKILCITDPKTHPEFDTTNELYNELASDSRFELFHTSLAVAHSPERFLCCPIQRPLTYAEFLELDSHLTEAARFSDFAIVYDRADFPLPPQFHESLSKYQDQTVFVNTPLGLIETKQKAFGYRIAERFFNESLFTRSLDEAEHFLDRFPAAVAKMNTSYGGKGVFRILHDERGYLIDNVAIGELRFPERRALLEWLFERDPEPFQFGRYLKNVVEGDKRILVVGTEIYGGYLRKSPSGSWIQNVTSGGKAHPAQVTRGEREIIEKTAPAFIELGVHTLGYDFLLDDDGESWCLSEINAGNIGGYGRLQSTSGKPVYTRLLDWLIERAQKGTV